MTMVNNLTHSALLDRLAAASESARRVAQKDLRIVDSDYSELETHIFFDDAFEISDDNDEKWSLTDTSSI
jgi:hypothetical protein